MQDKNLASMANLLHLLNPINRYSKKEANDARGENEDATFGRMAFDCESVQCLILK